MSMSRRSFLRYTTTSLLGASFSGVGVTAYATEIEPDWIETTQIRLKLPQLAPEFHGYRIAQISDLHINTWLGQERLRNVVKLVNEQQPDLVAVTGDFVSYAPDLDTDPLVEELSQLIATDGSVAVLGNHDYLRRSNPIPGVIQDSGMIALGNTVLTLERGSAQFHISGVNSAWRRQADLDQVLAQLPNTGAAILLAHEPDFADESAATGRFDLQISGHSHGGQVNLPFLGPPVLPRLGQKYPSGLYRVGEMYQYTNRGVGMTPPTVRLNCRPEITIFTLEAANQA